MSSVSEIESRQAHL